MFGGFNYDELITFLTIFINVEIRVYDYHDTQSFQRIFFNRINRQKIQTLCPNRTILVKDIRCMRLYNRIY